jgi:hypothetical protein
MRISACIAMVSCNIILLILLLNIADQSKERSLIVLLFVFILFRFLGYQLQNIYISIYFFHIKFS